MLNPTLTRTLIAMLLLSVAGCSARDKRVWRQKPAEENFRLALESKVAEERREAVVQIAEGGYVAKQEAFSVLDAVARTDPVVQIRCLAIRAFSRYYDARPAATLLAIIVAGPDSEEALPATPETRWEAVQSLAALDARGVFDDRQRDAIRATLIQLLQTDKNHNVKVASAQALGAFKHPDVLPVLITALRDKNFAVAQAAEDSLIRLTGTTHNYDADAWEAWLANTSEPFAHAGRKVVTSRPAGPNWFERQARSFQRAIKWGNTAQR